MRKKRGGPRSYYDTFVNYLSIMHNEAINLLKTLDSNDREYILSVFFREYYGTPKEHYWSITKLFRHAMYIPMFLQIGRRYFRELVYIDTHSGPGLAKIGSDDDEIVLGSPLIALRWPQIVASKVSHFRSIQEGFTRLYFIEKLPKTHGVLYVLKKKLDNSDKATVKCGDANEELLKIRIPKHSLVYIFMDPYGGLDAQIRIDVLTKFTNDNPRIDMMVSLFASNIARGLSGIKDPEKRLDKVLELLGENFCDLGCAPTSLCNGHGNVSIDDILNAYLCALENLGLNVAASMPVRFEKGILYYTILATTHKNAEWIKGYVEYINTKSPQDYTTLKNLWLKASGKQKGLDKWYNVKP